MENHQIISQNALDKYSFEPFSLPNNDPCHSLTEGTAYTEGGMGCVNDAR